MVGNVLIASCQCIWMKHGLHGKCGLNQSKINWGKKWKEKSLKVVGLLPIEYFCHQWLKCIWWTFNFTKLWCLAHCTGSADFINHVWWIYGKQRLFYCHSRFSLSDTTKSILLQRQLNGNLIHQWVFGKQRRVDERREVKKSQRLLSFDETTSASFYVRRWSRCTHHHHNLAVAPAQCRAEEIEAMREYL